MSTGALIGLIIAVVVVAAVVVLGPALLRQVRMRRQFGPEYDRLAKELGARKAAAELTARQRAGAGPVPGRRVCRRGPGTTPGS